MLRSLPPLTSSRMSCSTVSAACVHGRAHVRALFVQTKAAARRRRNPIKQQAPGHSSSSGSVTSSFGSQIVAASFSAAANTSSSLFGSLDLGTSPGAFFRGPLLQRTLATSLRMMLYWAFKAYGMADAANTERMQLGPRLHLGHPNYSRLHDLAERKGGKLTNKDVRDWLMSKDNSQHLDDLGIDLNKYDIDHILPVRAKGLGTGRSDHPMNLFLMPSAQNSSYGCRVSLAKCLHVGLRVWCTVLCWHVLTYVGGMQPKEAMELARVMAANPHDFLNRAKETGAVAASA